MKGDDTCDDVKREGCEGRRNHPVLRTSLQCWEGQKPPRASDIPPMLGGAKTTPSLGHPSNVRRGEAGTDFVGD
jgi:hypothetical protein